MFGPNGQRRTSKIDISTVIRKSIFEPLTKQEELRSNLDLSSYGSLARIKTSGDVKFKDACWNIGQYKSQILVCDNKGYVHLHDFKNGGAPVSVPVSDSWINSIHFEPYEGNLAAAGTLNSKIAILYMNEKKTKAKSTRFKKAHELVGHTGSIACVRFLSNKYLISGSTDAMLGLWDYEYSQKYLSMNQSHTSDIIDLCVHENDSNIFLSSSSDLTTKIWDIRMKSPVQMTFTGHESNVNSVKFLPGNSFTYFASGAEDSTIRLYDLRVGKELLIYQDQESYDPIYSISFSKSGRLIFAGTENSALKIWDTLNGPEKHSMLDCGYKKSISFVTFSEDYNLLLVGDQDGDFKIVGPNAMKAKN